MIRMKIPSQSTEGEWFTYEGPLGSIDLQIRPIFQEKRDAINAKNARYEFKTDPATGERLRVLTAEAGRAVLDDTIDWVIQDMRNVEVEDEKGNVISNTNRRAKLHVIHNSENELLAFAMKHAKDQAFEIEQKKEQRAGNC